MVKQLAENQNPTNDNGNHLLGEAQLLKTEQVAELIGFAVQTLADWRLKEKGPKYYKTPGGDIRYKLADVLEWEQQALVPVKPKEL